MTPLPLKTTTLTWLAGRGSGSVVEVGAAGAGSVVAGGAEVEAAASVVAGACTVEADEAEGEAVVAEGASVVGATEELGAAAEVVASSSGEESSLSLLQEARSTAAIKMTDIDLTGIRIADEPFSD